WSLRNAFTVEDDDAEVDRRNRGLVEEKVNGRFAEGAGQGGECRPERRIRNLLPGDGVGVDAESSQNALRCAGEASLQEGAQLLLGFLLGRRRAFGELDRRDVRPVREVEGEEQVAVGRCERPPGGEDLARRGVVVQARRLTRSGRGGLGGREPGAEDE